MTAIYEAIPAILQDVEAIGKHRQNKQQGFAFRGIDDVYNVLHPLLAKHKVFPTCQVLDVTRQERETKAGNLMYCVTIKARYTLYAADGSNVCTEAISEGIDTADKATNKAMSGCYKYAMFQLLCIPTEAIDPDSETPEPVKARREPLPGRAAAPAAETVKQLAAEHGMKTADQLVIPSEWLSRFTDAQNQITQAASVEELEQLGAGWKELQFPEPVKKALAPLYKSRKALLQTQPQVA